MTMSHVACRYAIVAEDDPPTRYRIDDEHTGTVARYHDEEARGLTLRRARAVRSERVVPPDPMTTVRAQWARAARAYDLAYRAWDTARRDPVNRPILDDLYADLTAARDALATTPDPRDVAEQDG